MRILVDGIDYDRQRHGGIKRIFDEILPRMCDLDPTLQITLCATTASAPHLPQHAHITHASIGKLERYLPPRFRKPGSRLLRRIERQAIMLPHMGNIWHSTYFTLPRLWRGPIVVTLSGLTPPGYYPIYDRLLQRSIQSADMFIAISQTTKNAVLEQFNVMPDKVVVASLACSDVFRVVPQLEWRCELPTDRPFLLYVGANRVHKNLDGLLKSYRIWSRRKEIALIIATNTVFAEADKEILSELEHDVFVLVNSDDTTLCELYNRAQAFVFPSLYEAFGIPLLEAMACGCPIAASRIPATIEVAGDCPVYFDPNDTDSMIAALDEVLSIGRDRVPMGFERAKQFSWDRTAAETLAVYRTLAG